MEGQKITQIVKRDGVTVSFDQEKITIAIHKAAGAVGIHDKPLCRELSDKVLGVLNKTFGEKEEKIPTVEEIQDIVEEILIQNNYPQIAKSYILYRDKRAQKRINQNSKQKKCLSFRIKKYGRFLTGI